MTDVLNRREFALQVVQHLVSAGYEAFWAGGCVRDQLLGHKPDDYDVATSARPEQVRELFGRGRTLAVGESFGVMIVLGPDRQAGQVEVATFRTDGTYLDGRRPNSVEFCSAKEDAQRRDFTINGMFYDPLEQKLIDFVGGEADLHNRILRSIGSPSDRFTEDKLRMLRAIRFTARFGFTLDTETFVAIQRQASQIHIVSQERITAEFQKMTNQPELSSMLVLLEQTGLLMELFPELTEAWQQNEYRQFTFHLLEQQLDWSLPLFLAVLLRFWLPDQTELNSKLPQVEQLTRRWKFSNSDASLLQTLLNHVSLLRNARQLPLHLLKPILADKNWQTVQQFFELVVLEIPERQSQLVYVNEYRGRSQLTDWAPTPILTGADLMQKGLKPGKQLGLLLNELHRLQLDEVITTKEAAEAFVDSKIK